MGKRRLILWLVLLLMLAAVILPVRSKVIQLREHRAHVKKLEMYLETLGEQALERQKNLARWYNYHLSLGEPGLEAAYGRILNFGNGMMAVLEVPQMHVRLPVFHGEDAVVGHLPDSDFPIGGRGNHTVLNMEEWLPWKTGMIVYIDCLGSRNGYRVESVQIMPSGWSTDWPSEQERLTILYDRGEKRTIVRCVRCGELMVRPSEKPVYLLTALLLLPIKILWKWTLRSHSRRKYRGIYHKNRRNSKLF